MRRFKQSGFGLVVAFVCALMSAYLSVTTTTHLIDLRGRMLCGNYVGALHSQFELAIFFMMLATLGWRIARGSKYGEITARCAVLAAVTAWVVCQFALGIDLPG